MNIEGNKIKINKSAEDLFNYLIKLENYEQLMPEDIKKFEIDGDSFIFGLKGAPEIRMVLKDKSEFDKVVLGAASSKLPFTLSSVITPLSEHECETVIKFESDFNPMMAMMVKKPLTNFIESLTENLKNI